MNPNQAKNWGFHLVYRSTINFEKSPKYESTGPSKVKRIKETNTRLTEHFEAIFPSSFCFLINRLAGELHDLA